MGSYDEIIVAVLAPAEVLGGIALQGMDPVFADLDAETLSLTPRTVLDQVTVHTRGVYVTPVLGVMGDWEALRSVTEPRGIPLQVEGQGGKSKWERVAPGLRGMASGLIEVDGQVIYGGAEGLAETLEQFGIQSGRVPEWRGKQRDYPGMASIQKQVLVIENWRELLPQLQQAARLASRQGHLQFEDLRRPPVRAGLGETRRSVAV